MRLLTKLLGSGTIGLRRCSVLHHGGAGGLQRSRRRNSRSEVVVLSLKQSIPQTREC
jgi:hypothetical protein